jgi:hypothetical protein
MAYNGHALLWTILPIKKEENALQKLLRGICVLLGLSLILLSGCVGRSAEDAMNRNVRLDEFEVDLQHNSLFGGTYRGEGELTAGGGDAASGQVETSGIWWRCKNMWFYVGFGQTR